MEYQVTTFTAPSGHTYTIREQNGQDEEILSNLREINNLMNLTNFLQAIILKSSRKASKFTIQEVLDLPILDRYAILIQSRIFSIGETLEFKYRWPVSDGVANEVEYEQDLNEFLLPYDEIPNMDPEKLAACLEAHPEAIPIYPKQGQEKGIVMNLNSGKRIKFDLLDGNSERYMGKLTEATLTRNSEFIARNLCLEVEGKWDPVSNFSLFSVKDMYEMRRIINNIDPLFIPCTKIANPLNGEQQSFNILTTSNFFFPEDVPEMP